MSMTVLTTPLLRRADKKGTRTDMNLTEAHTDD